MGKKVSIIIPVYNTRDFLPRCLDALIRQTDKDWEALCVDDGSGDGSGAVLDEYARRDKRIRAFHQKNAGPATARNTGLANAAGDYLMFCDSDDWYEPTMVEEMVACIEREQVDFVQCDAAISEEGVSRGQGYYDYMRLRPELRGHHALQDVSRLYVPALLWKTIFRMDLVRAHKIRFPDGYEHDDAAFISCYALVAKTSFGLARVLYNYVQRENSVMDGIFKKTKPEQVQLDPVNAAFFVYDWIRTEGLLEAHRLFAAALLERRALYCYQCVLSTCSLRHYLAVLKKGLEERRPDLSETPFLAAVVRNDRAEIARQLAARRPLVDAPEGNRGKGFGHWLLGRFFRVEETETEKVVFVFCCPIVRRVLLGDQKALYLGKLRMWVGARSDRIPGNGAAIPLARAASVSSAISSIMALRQYQETHGGETGLVLLSDAVYDAKAECIDAYTLYRYLKSQGVPCRYFIAKQNSLNAKTEADPDVIPLAYPNELFDRYRMLIASAKMFITAFGLYEPYNAILKTLPFLDYVFIEHGVIALKKTVVVNLYNPTRFSRTLCPTTLTQKAQRRVGLWPEAQLIKCGLPRWDVLEREPHFGKTILVFFTWRETLNQEPTFLPLYEAMEMRFMTEVLKLVRGKNIRVRFALHHQDKVSPFILPPGVELVNGNNLSTAIHKADLLVTDYSSVCFDLMYLDVPVVFYRFDAIMEGLRPNDQVALVSSMDEDAALYNCCYTLASALAAVTRYVNNGFVLEPENKAKNAAVFYMRDNTCRALAGMLGLVGPSPDGKK